MGSRSSAARITRCHAPPSTSISMHLRPSAYASSYCPSRKKLKARVFVRNAAACFRAPNASLSIASSSMHTVSSAMDWTKSLSFMASSARCLAWRALSLVT